MSENNMRIWDAVSKTDPKYTKPVSQRGGFTAINANSQIMEATRHFGPIGIGWGYTTGEPYFHETLMFVPVTLWHSGDRSTAFGPLIGCEEWKDAKGRVDSDVGKKATTDAVTKGLSQLGFNADVFLGLFDDQKYVAAVTREFAEQPEAIPLITDDQRTIIQGLAEAAGTDLMTICKAARIESLPHLPAAAFDGVITKLKAKIAANATPQQEAA